MRKSVEAEAYETGMSGVEFALIGVVLFVGLIGVASLMGWSFPVLLARLDPMIGVSISP
jgi:hypothetical protein